MVSVTCLLHVFFKKNNNYTTGKSSKQNSFSSVNTRNFTKSELYNRGFCGGVGSAYSGVESNSANLSSQLH